MRRIFIQITMVLGLVCSIILTQEGVSSTPIPRILHFIHLSDAELSAPEKESIRLWVEKNPGYKAQLWGSNSNSSFSMEGVENREISDLGYKILSRAFATAESPSEREEILRYEILLREGGVFVDEAKDAGAFLDPLVNQYDLFYSVASQENPCDCGSFIVGATPEHPAIKKTIETLFASEVNINESLKEKVASYLQSAVEESRLDESFRCISIPSSAFALKSSIMSTESNDLSSYVFDVRDPHQSDIDKVMSTSLARLKVQSRHFLSHFFALIALSLISMVMLAVIVIKIKQRYFS